jgi:hypothetical protein
MDLRNKILPIILALLPVFLSLALVSCALKSSSSPATSENIQPDVSALKMQALVMDMADDYIASLGETVYLLTRTDKLDSKGRWLAQSFLRNGVGASLDIAVGPNPAVNVLDFLVLTSLQTWSFEVHWIPAGIGQAGRVALERLKRADDNIWASAEKALSRDQLRTLRSLIDAWRAENPDRTVVALVRFDEFADERKMSSLSLRGQARGLLKQVDGLIGSVDEARLLGERLIWFAGRFPYLLGEQAELTAYRLVDQPEGSQLVETITSARELSQGLTRRLETLSEDLDDQQTALFARIADERAAAIAQLRAELKVTANQSIDLAAERIRTIRAKALGQFFDRIALERTSFFDELSSRQDEFLELMNELVETISVSGSLARDLTETVKAIDHVVSRFDTDPQEENEPLRMTDVRDAAIETGLAAEKMRHLLERSIELLESDLWERRIASVTDPADTVIDRLFLRGLVLIGFLLLGLVLLRLIPQRHHK